MSILDDLYKNMVGVVGSGQATPDLWRKYLASLGYTQSTVLGQMQAYAAANGMPIVSVLNYVASVASATVPDAPTIGTATAGDLRATVTFTAPANNGGSAITGYTVTSSPGGFTGTGAASPITVTGLTNGVAYTFTVTATNAIGTSAASAASNSVTPAVVNLLTNGDFAGGTTGWTTVTGWTITAGAAVKSTAGGGNLSQDHAFEAGATYEVTFDITSYTAGSCRPRFIGGTAVFGATNRAAVGTYVENLVAATGNITFAINSDATGSLTVDNIILRKIS